MGLFGVSEVFMKMEQVVAALRAELEYRPDVVLMDIRMPGMSGLDLQQELNRRGLHPALGAVTLSQLLATWAAHDLTHLHQISRIMAHQYREAVGPWSAYLGGMQCAGHSA